MEITYAPGDLPQGETLFHVAKGPIPVGQRLRPYHLRTTYEPLVVAALEALATDTDAVARLLANAEWVRLAARREYLCELILLEAIFERTRTQVAPLLPSRLDTVFGWRTLATAQVFRARYRPDGAIYRCAAVGRAGTARDGALVAAGIDLARSLAGELGAVEQRAIRYWKGEEPMELPEMLIEGTLIIQERVTG